MSGRYDNLPPGPLAFDDFEGLSLSFYDASRLEDQETARSRGIEQGDYLRLKLAQKIARVANQDVGIEDE